MTGPGEYAIHSGSSFIDLATGTSYGIEVRGKITFTVVDFDKPEFAGTFEAVMEQLLPRGDGSITAANGRFRILNTAGPLNHGR